MVADTVGRVVGGCAMSSDPVGWICLSMAAPYQLGSSRETGFEAGAAALNPLGVSTGDWSSISLLSSPALLVSGGCPSSPFPLE
jgi:hypothetical protein